MPNPRHLRQFARGLGRLYERNSLALSHIRSSGGTRAHRSRLCSSAHRAYRQITRKQTLETRLQDSRDFVRATFSDFPLNPKLTSAHPSGGVHANKSGIRNLKLFLPANPRLHLRYSIVISHTVGRHIFRSTTLFPRNLPERTFVWTLSFLCQSASQTATH